MNTQETPTVVNPDDKEWFDEYLVKITRFGTPYTVYASDEGTAIDELIDWAEDNAPGYLWSYEEEAEEDDLVYLNEFIVGGNHGRRLSTYHIRIELVNRV